MSDRRGHHKTDDEVDELERLRRENIRLKRQLEEKDMAVELLKKSERIRKDVRLGKQRFESKYMAIQYFTEKRQWNINWMCRQLEISRAAYYKWLHRSIPKQEEENIKSCRTDKRVRRTVLPYLRLPANDKLDKPFQPYEL